MEVTEAQRHQLFESAKAVFGEASAEIFMNLQPNVESRNLATKDDIARLDLATKAHIANLDFATSDDMARFDAHAAALRADMKTELAGLELRLQNRFVTVLSPVRACSSRRSRWSSRSR